MMPAIEVNVAVIGCPGHGKSTFLNALANTRNAFRVGAGGESCTKDVQRQTFNMAVGEGTVNVTLVDTMGFPDPDKSKAAVFYDQVVDAIRQPLHAIVWVVKMEREIHTLVEGYAVLMREFNNAGPPIFIVVNGMETYEDDEERAEMKAEHLNASECFGYNIAKAAGVEVARVFAGAEKADLKGKVKNELGTSLQGSELRPSPSLRTFNDLEMERNRLTSQKDAIENERRRLEEADSKKRQNIADMESACVQAAHYNRPIFNWEIRINATALQDKNLRLIDIAKQELNASAARNQVLMRNADEMAPLASSAEAAFTSLKKALGV
eukprot:NODE_1067_length_1252_cov_411.255639.p1 GENE.NODE_1067_length_1252_cov_411.255639~~NODE_1067_length_1252_cov_411.255639.p1  ORF type:complete len:351 (-),score=52.02 NODE_1067_length_1252_cov_411.255639:183-1154(-)